MLYLIVLAELVLLERRKYRDGKKCKSAQASCEYLQATLQSTECLPSIAAGQENNIDYFSSNVNVETHNQCRCRTDPGLRAVQEKGWSKSQGQGKGDTNRDGYQRLWEPSRGCGLCGFDDGDEEAGETRGSQAA